jgi:hypothetical protein
LLEEFEVTRKPIAGRSPLFISCGPIGVHADFGAATEANVLTTPAGWAFSVSLNWLLAAILEDRFKGLGLTWRHWQAQSFETTVAATVNKYIPDVWRPG